MRIRESNNPDFAPKLVSAFMVEPLMEYVSKDDASKGRVAAQETVKTADGEVLPRWVIHCNFVDQSQGFTVKDQLEVRVPSAREPAIPAGGCPVVFNELYLNIQERKSGDGKGFTRSFSAESFTLDLPSPSPSSAKRSTSKSEPPVPEPAKT